MSYDGNCWQPLNKGSRSNGESPGKLSSCKDSAPRQHALPDLALGTTLDTDPDSYF